MWEANSNQRKSRIAGTKNPGRIVKVHQSKNADCVISWSQSVDGLKVIVKTGSTQPNW